ncbi:MAG: hypothetical protein GXP56_08745 [Deltaproteobacteria bacterium]|nr:hypothetical protein [Deltaproteobacteria bacterium]
MNSLTELKKIIQSMNENITDDGIYAFQNELLKLLQYYENNKAVASFLKMMQSLGKYLGSKKSNAHKDSIPVLNSIFKNLEKFIDDPELEQSKVNMALSCEIQKYKSLKNKIASKPVINKTDLDKLKAVILAIDWEISNTTLQNFEEVVTRLLLKLKNYKIHHAFLKIIHSTGRYIGIQKANAHTDSISFLRLVFENYEHMINSPDMNFKEKKQVLEKNINRFHEFKLKISSKKNKIHPQEIIPEDEPVKPALSHVKPAGMHRKVDIVPLTALTEKEDSSLAGNIPDPDIIMPALAGKKRSSAGKKDIMDDLFCVKESPADELLDAIHLMDIQDNSQDQDLNMLDRAEDSQSSGIKNFTPERMDNDPIPEIGSRLDEFFSLDDSPGSVVATREKTGLKVEKPALKEENKEDDDRKEGLVPFQYEDESFEEPKDKKYSSETLPESTGLDILNRLKSSFETAQWPLGKSLLSSISKDISSLENLWENDPDKTCLLQIIESSINLFKTCPQNTYLENQGISDAPQKKPAGIWDKIKGIFSS